MNKILKNKVFAGAFVFALAIVGFAFTNQAEAALRTASVTGNWSNTATWGGLSVPVAGDTVTINGNVTVTVDVAAAATSVTFVDPVSAGSNGLTISGTNSLTLSGALNIPGSTGTSGTVVAVGAGSLTASNIVMADGAGAGDIVVSVSTGSIATTGTGIAITTTETSDAQLLATSTGSITLGGTTGTITATGTPTVTLNSASTVAFTGSGAQVIPVYTYGNLTKSGAGTATLATGTIPVLGNLSVAAGTLDLGAAVPTITGTTTVGASGTLLLSSLTGTKTFTGDVTNDGTWTESAAVVANFGGSLTNTGTFTASTGAHTFSGTSEALTGTLVIPSVSVSGTISNTNSLTVATLLTVAGTLTNNGTVTATTSLAGAGTFVNGSSAILNLGGTSGITTLTATASDNEVHYNAAGAQTVKSTEYKYLYLEGSGTKSMTTVTVGNDLNIASGVVADLTGVSTTNILKTNGSIQNSGTWGFTGSGAENIDTTYFAGTGTLNVSGGGSTGGGGGGGGSRSNRATPATPANEAKPADCTAGVMFSPSTGRNCNAAVPAVPAGCTSTTAFSPLNGQKCPMTTTTVVVGSSNGAAGYAFGTLTVKMGSKGGACLAWQTFLNAHGASLATDGACGKLTMAAARAWQASVGLTADGVLGPKSRAKAMMQ